jgi:hypothetical protein
MKKVLIISYHFPPEGGPSVQRISKFVKYMPQFGYIPIVLTTHPNSKIVDFSLLNDLPEKININRTVDFGRYIPGDLKNKILSKYFIPDKFLFWKLTAIRTGLRLIRENNIELIFSTSPPHSVHLIAREVAEKTNIPWVADFRDEWTAFPSFYKQKKQLLQQKQEYEVLQFCSHVVTVTNTCKKNFTKKIAAKKVTVIRNGFDKEDFTHIQKDFQNKTNKITITYCGRLNQLHSPDLLFRYLSDGTKADNSFGKKINVVFIGNIENKKYLNKYPELKDVVNFLPYQSHKQCIESMANSTLLLLLATKMDSTEFIPAKLYEYMFLRKPIFAIISSSGELSQLLNVYGNRYVAFENDPDAVKSMLSKIINDYENDLLKNPDDNGFVSQFSRKKLTSDLSEVFNRISGDK